MDANLKKCLFQPESTGFGARTIPVFDFIKNDLPLCSKIFGMIIYADDTTLYCDIHGVPNIQHLLNAELS